MAAGWLYNPGNPHAADPHGGPQFGTGLRCGECAQIPKYYRITGEPFTVAEFPDESTNVSFGPTDAIVKKIKHEHSGRINGKDGACEWWWCPPDRYKLMKNWSTENTDPVGDWEANNPGLDWHDFFPLARWYLTIGYSFGGTLWSWTVIAQLWRDPGWPIPSVISGGGASISYDFPWLTATPWSCFGRNELISGLPNADDPNPRVWVEAYYP